MPAAAADLDAVLEKGVSEGAAPGIVAAVVDADGVTYLGSAGERSIGTGVEMTTDTVGAIFSMTKVITGTAAMQLVEQGKLDLDADAGTVCPELSNPVVLEGFDDDGQPVTRPAVGPITLRHLLTHTAGFVYDVWNPQMAQWYEATGTPNIFSLEKKSLAIPLMFDPGTQWQYGINIDWVGLMIEAVSGQTLGEYCTENIFAPLGMNETTFAPTDALLGRASAMHTRMEDGAFVAIDLPQAENPEFEMGGGGLVSTMSDYAKFIRMILNDGEVDGVRVLGASTVADMSQNHMGDLRVSELKTAMPPFSVDAEMFAGEAKSWGLTFQVHEEASATGAPKGTLSWAGLANSFFWIDRENGLGGCYMSQLIPFAEKGTVDTFYSFMSAVYDGR